MGLGEVISDTNYQRDWELVPKKSIAATSILEVCNFTLYNPTMSFDTYNDANVPKVVLFQVPYIISGNIKYELNEYFKSPPTH